MTDEALIQLFLDRSEGAAEALAEQYGPYCRTVAGQLLSDSRDVEECLNDCWLAVRKAIPPAKPEHFRGWLAAIVRNRALAIGKANGRRPETVEEAALELASCLPQEDDAHGSVSANEWDPATIGIPYQEDGSTKEIIQEVYTTSSGLDVQIVTKIQNDGFCVIYAGFSINGAAYNISIPCHNKEGVLGTTLEGGQAVLIQVLDSFVL